MNTGSSHAPALPNSEGSSALVKKPSADMIEEISEKRKRRASFQSWTPTPHVAVSVLHENEYVECISDRVDMRDRYPFEGNEEIMEQVMKSIFSGGSVLVVGEPGRGKRTLSLGLARRFADLQKQDPKNPLHSRQVYTLALGPSFWDHGSQDDICKVQKQIQEVLRVVEAAGPENIVFCIDDVDILSFVDKLAQKQSPLCGSPLSGSTGAQDNSEISSENMLRYLLFNRKVVCLCTCIRGAYQRLIYSDTFYDEKFTKTFRVLHMPEPSVAQTLQIVRAHRKRIETDCGVVLLDEALSAATAYAKHYLTHREMPESALDIVCEASKAAAEQATAERDVAMGQSTGGAKTLTVVGREPVDQLIKEWCGYSGEQLVVALSKAGMR